LSFIFTNIPKAASVNDPRRNPFNHDSSGPKGLLATMLQTFELSEKFQILPPWEKTEYDALVGLDKNPGKLALPGTRPLPGLVKIMLPLRLTFWCEKLKEYVRFDVQTLDYPVSSLLGDITRKVVGFDPALTRLVNTRNGMEVDPRLTVREANLYRIACCKKEVEVRFYRHPSPKFDQPPADKDKSMWFQEQLHKFEDTFVKAAEGTTQ